jgi:hypothetical protein
MQSSGADARAYLCGAVAYQQCGDPQDAIATTATATTVTAITNSTSTTTSATRRGSSARCQLYRPSCRKTAAPTLAMRCML